MVKATLITFVILIATQVNAQEEQVQWRLNSDDDGIQVYVIDMDGSDIVKAKAVTVIKSNLDRIRQELDNIDSRHEWVPFLQQSKLIYRTSDSHRLEYSLFSAPWPASNRDFVYSLERVLESADQLKYAMKSVSTVRMPEQEGLIRGEIYESIYTLTKLENNLTKVELIYHADPKGWLPNWIVNIIQKILPHKILRNLRRRVELIEA